MGKIKRAFISDKFGIPLNQNGSGRVTDILNNFSGEKKYERIVLNIEVEFDNGEKSYLVLKIANLDSDESISYSDEYTNYLDSKLTPENSLSNKYLHESIIYNFFLENREDPIIKKYVIKSRGSGITRDGNINLLRKDGVFEKVHIFDNPSINQIVQYNKWTYPSTNSYVYITTEFNPNSISLDNGLEFYLNSQNYSERKAEQKRKNIRFVNSTIETMIYLNQTFGFCHWDFHAGNVRYCRETGNLELFDFDLSTINYEKTINNTLVSVKNSHYIHYIPFIYFLVKQIQKKYSFLQNEKGYYIAKNKLAHYLDIYQFIRYLIIIGKLNDSREYNDSAFIQTIVDIDNWSRNVSILNDYLIDNWYRYMGIL